MAQYIKGFNDGMDFVLHEIEQEHARTGSKDVLALLMHLRGQDGQEIAQESMEGAVSLMLEVLRYLSDREKNKMAKTMAEDAILAGEELLGKIT